MSMNSKKIGSALILVAIAVIVLLNALDVFHGSVAGFVLLVILTVCTVKMILDKSFSALIPLSLIPFILVKFNFIPESLAAYEVIDKITPWPLLITSVLIAIALKLVFGHDKSIVSVSYTDKDGHPMNDPENIKYSTSSTNETDSFVEVANTFGETSKYVNSQNLTGAQLSNAFGQTNVYFNNAYASANGAVIKVKNSFGELNIEVPSSWRTVVKKSSVFGDVNESGREISDPNSPAVRIEADNVFGEINIRHC